MWFLLFFSLAVAGHATSDTLHAVDVYGMRTVSEASLRAAIALRAGDPVPASVDSIRARVQALSGVAEAHVSVVCCSENGRKLLYVGIRETGTPPMVFRAEPSGAARLPSDILSEGDRFASALMRAVQRGATDEDDSQGYALAQDSALRSVQEGFVRIAAKRSDTLASVLRYSADATHRALAAQVLAYGVDRSRVSRELLYAAEDPSDAVRNNATRALAVMATWLTRNRHAGITIPADLFVDFVNSVSWTDRNKGVMVLLPLTASRDSALLAELRSQALPSLVEMARWSNAGHALAPFLILARIAGLDDGDAFQAWQAGEREAVIARAMVRQPRTSIAQSPITGTYRLLLCETPCAEADSAQALALATIVFADDSLARTTEWTSAMTAIRGRRLMRQSGAMDNVCFNIERSSATVASEELFFGIYRNGSTHLQRTAVDSLAIRVYQSPDAEYVLRWAGTDDRIAGEGWSAGWQATRGRHRNAYFVARRTGPPAVDACR